MDMCWSVGLVPYCDQKVWASSFLSLSSVKRAPNTAGIRFIMLETRLFAPNPWPEIWGQHKYPGTTFPSPSYTASPGGAHKVSQASNNQWNDTSKMALPPQPRTCHLSGTVGRATCSLFLIKLRGIPYTVRISGWSQDLPKIETT